MSESNIICLESIILGHVTRISSSNKSFGLANHWIVLNSEIAT